MNVLLEVDPNLVKPGWGALVLTLLLAAAIALLMISMRRQMRKIQVPYRDQLGEESDQATEDDSDGGGDDQHGDDHRADRDGHQHPIGHSG